MMQIQSKKNKGKSKKSRRPLTDKEKFLLMILLVLLSFYGLFRFVFLPQKEKIEGLEGSKISLNDKIEENNRILRSESKIKEDWISLTQERDLILDDFFPSLDQSQIIYLLNDLILSEDIDSIDLNFSKASIETINENSVKKMDVYLPFKGGYAGIFEIIKAIEKSPKKIIISDINFDKNEDFLSGNMNLKIYSLEGLATTNKDVIHVESTDGNTGNPFSPFEDYRGSNNGTGGDDKAGDSDGNMDSPPIGNNIPDNDYNEGPNINDTNKDIEDKSILYDFESGKYEFFSLNPMFQGIVTSSSLSLSGNASLKFDYGIFPSDNINTGYIDLLSNNIIIDKEGGDLNLWVYSSNESTGKIGIVFKDSKNRDIAIEFVDKISWTGWEAQRISLPRDNKLYPLKLDRLTFEFKKDREDHGSLLFDKLEYDTEYFYYKVKSGDTIYGISKKIYGSTNYVQEIMSLNNIKPKDILSVGRNLKLRKHN